MQEDIAELLGIDASSVSRIEFQRQLPALDVVIAYEAVFGLAVSDIYPDLKQRRYEDVLTAAKQLRNELPARPGYWKDERLAFLDDLIERLQERPRLHRDPK
jgi:transcriptional regulator with XRE-family HTH domain